MKKIPLLTLLFSAVSSISSHSAVSKKIVTAPFLIHSQAVSLDILRLKFERLVTEINNYAMLMQEKEFDENKKILERTKSLELASASDSLIVQNIDKVRSKQSIILSIIEDYILFSNEYLNKISKTQKIAKSSIDKMQYSQFVNNISLFDKIKQFLDDFESILEKDNPGVQVVEFLKTIRTQIDNQSNVTEIAHRLNQLNPEFIRLSELIKESLMQHKNAIMDALKQADIPNDDKDNLRIRELIQSINQIIETPEPQTLNESAYFIQNQKQTSLLLDKIIPQFFIPYSKEQRKKLANIRLSAAINPKLQFFYHSLRKLGIIEDGLAALQKDTILKQAEKIIAKSTQGERELLYPLLSHLRSSSIALTNLSHAFLQNISDLRVNFEQTKLEISKIYQEISNLRNTNDLSIQENEIISNSNANYIENEILTTFERYTAEQSKIYSPFEFSAYFHQNNIDFINSEKMKDPINRKYMNMILYMADLKLFLQNVMTFTDFSAIPEYIKIAQDYQRIIKIIQYFQGDRSNFSYEWKSIDLTQTYLFLESVQDMMKMKSSQNKLDMNTDNEFDFSRDYQNDTDDQILNSNEIDQLTDEELIKRIQYLDIGNTIIEDIQNTKKESDALNKILGEKERLEPKYIESFGKSHLNTRRFISLSEFVRSSLINLINTKKSISFAYSQVLKDQDYISKNPAPSNQTLRKMRDNYKKLMQYKSLDEKKRDIENSLNKLTIFVRNTLSDDEAYSLQHSYKADFVNILVQGINAFLEAAQKK